MKIAAVTASGYASERRQIVAEGLDDYVRKPYRPEEIFDCMARHLGVRYQADETAAAFNGKQPGELTAEALSDLPEELRNELRQALITLVPSRISAVIERIANEDKSLGLILSDYADRYAYSKIFDATEREG